MCGGISHQVAYYSYYFWPFLEVCLRCCKCDIVSRSRRSVNSFGQPGQYKLLPYHNQRRRHTDHVIRRRRIFVCLDLPVRSGGALLQLFIARLIIILLLNRKSDHRSLLALCCTALTGIVRMAFIRLLYFARPAAA